MNQHAFLPAPGSPIVSRSRSWPSGVRPSTDSRARGDIAARATRRWWRSIAYGTKLARNTPSYSGVIVQRSTSWSYSVGMRNQLRRS